MRRINRINSKTQTGFTLIELLITISLAMIILSFAVPSFSSFIKNGRVTTITNTLVTDVNYARHEAVTRGANVVLCRSANPTAATPACGGNSNDWSSGWLIFISKDTNTVYDDGVDTLLRVGARTEGTVGIKSNAVSDAELVYKADGTIDMGGGTAVFAVCDDRGEGQGNQLQVGPTGRPRLITPVPNTCASPSV
ncbi:MAG: GspH/FimT family pseudopilin [Gammaproteobacteria bacterium]|jgi:type IV fimbrial biogenesis protein FimT